LSFPVSASVPLGEHWRVDVSAAYSRGEVTLEGEDANLGTSRYELSGLSDARVRATGSVSDHISLTFGLNLPFGRTSLDAEEYEAFRVLAAPALGLQVARLGSGVSGTAGVVLSQQLGDDWAGAIGVSYEVRSTYQPGALLVTPSDPDYSPSDALRFSAGVDGLLGQHGLTLGLSTDVYPSQDEITDPARDATVRTKLGPVVTADLQLRAATGRLRELTFYAVNRYRASYRIGVERSGSANYLDLGLRAVVSAGKRTGVLVSPNFRYQSGLDADRTLATAGMVGGLLTVGLLHDIGGGYSIHPFLRGQVGRIESGDASSSATELAGGLSLGLRF
jgi:hypothetical protein